MTVTDLPSRLVMTAGQRRTASAGASGTRSATRSIIFTVFVTFSSARTVGEEQPGTATLPLLIWKACSAVAHRDLWATINVTELERLDEVEGMAGNRVSASVPTWSGAGHRLDRRIPFN